MADEEDDTKENTKKPSDLGGTNNAETKKKPPSYSTDEASSSFSSKPLSQETEPVIPLVAEEEDNTKENPPTPELVRCQQRSNKVETAIISFIFVWTGKASDGASNKTPILVLSPDLASVPL